MIYEIANAEPDRHHHMGRRRARGVDFAPFIQRGEVFAALEDPTYFVSEMNILRGGIGLTWPNEVDFSADGLRHDAFPDEQIGAYDAPAATARQPNASPP